ncbi:MAG: HAMP domain-containing sensor histidine kinase [Cyclobacteriaceae bacterium]|nr:HAMP domain-containing histidine kinase [Cyclobacteriaceae bacterium]
MNIRNKLTLLFIVIVAIIITIASISIYYSSADYRQDDFYSRLMNKAINTAKLLIEVDEVDASLLRRIERDNPLSLPKEKIIIYNYKNEILFSTDEERELAINNQLLDKIRLEDQVRFTQGEFEVLGFLFSDEFDRFVVVTGATDIYGLKKLQNLRLILIIVFCASIVVVTFAGYVYAGRALKPISKVVANVQDISISSLDVRLDEGNGKDEIAQLTHTFNEMLERLERAFKTQKNFIANASHELRTPLTAITGQLEVLLMKDRTTEEYKVAVQSILEDIKNLNSISNRLLLLAQASNFENEKQLEPLRIDELLWQVREELIKHNREYKIEISLSVSVDDGHLSVMGDAQLLKTAISNVIENGCKYSQDHTVQVSLSADEEFLLLKFKDTGIGISPEDLKIVTEPFQRGKNAHKIKGHGIGLSLVSAIVKMHNATLDIRSDLNQGTEVAIKMRHLA